MEFISWAAGTVIALWLGNALANRLLLRRMKRGLDARVRFILESDEHKVKGR
jgi:hypothetical protein